MNNKTDIKAVFFDIGQVLLQFDKTAIARRIAWAVRHEPVKVARYLWKSHIVDSVERGELSPQELYRMFKKEFGYDGNYDDFKKLWALNAKLDQRTATLLKKLTATHKVYLLSNTNHLHFEWISQRYAFPAQVHGSVLSYRLGLRKPEKEIYRKALALARVKPAESVFIDDLEENITAAKRIGMNGIQFNGIENLLSELRGLKVL